MSERAETRVKRGRGGQQRRSVFIFHSGERAKLWGKNIFNSPSQREGEKTHLKSTTRYKTSPLSLNHVWSCFLDDKRRKKYPDESRWRSATSHTVFFPAGFGLMESSRPLVLPPSSSPQRITSLLQSHFSFRTEEPCASPCASPTGAPSARARVTLRVHERVILSPLFSNHDLFRYSAVYATKKM